MPVTRCIIGKKVGFKWGKSGKCYTYDPRSPTSKNSAKKKAIMQGLAIGKGRLRTDTVIKPEKPFITWLKAIGLSIPAIRSRLRRRAPRPFIPRTVENKYVRQLKILVGEWRTLYLQIVDPSLVGLAQEAYALKPPESVGVKTDAWPDRLEGIIDAYDVNLKKTLTPINTLTTDIAYDVSNLNLKQWKKVTSKVLGVNVFASEPWLVDQLSSFAKQNTNLITKLADETRSEVKRLVEDGLQRGKRIETIRKDILSTSGLTPGRFRKTKTRAELIARDQTAKLNGQLTQLRQNEIGIDRYEWKDVDDVKVRRSHSAMDRRLCRWDNAMVYSGDGGKTWQSRSGIGGVELHPGQDYQCRCIALADFSSIL